MATAKDGQLTISGRPRLLYPIEEAAYLLGLSRSDLYAHIARGDIKGVHVGQRSVRVPRAEIERFVAQLTEAS